MPNETPPKKKRRFFSRFMPSSVAGKATLATAVILVLTLVVVWLVRRFGPQSVPARHALTWSWMLVEFLLVLIIPIVLYWGLRRWNQVIEGVFPDIDQAWQAGIKSLQANGISVLDRPIFLVLGSSRTELERGLMNGLEMDFSVQGVPAETGIRHALQWYASADAIYLFCPGASSLSALMGRWTTPSAASGERRALPVGSRGPVVRQTDGPAELNVVDKSAAEAKQVSPAARTAASPSKQQEEAYLGTIHLQTIDDSQITGQSRPDAAAFSGPNTIMPSASVPERNDAASAIPQLDGTISAERLPASPTAEVSPQTGGSGRLRGAADNAVKLDTDRVSRIETRPEEKDRPETASASRATAPRFTARDVALPATLDTSDQLPRLQYVCELLRRIRRPRCGVNGIVTLIPFELSRAGPMHLAALSQSARGDINTIQNVLQIRVPVTALLVGLEQDKGFIELVRRLQANLLSRRLGGRFDLRSRPTSEELNAHSDRLCDAFEDWVYRLFGREDALAQQRGNRKLFGLISRIRHELKPRLRIMLGKVFGCESSGGSDDSAEDRSFFFSGCYFAASGEFGQPAFVKGVLQDKLVDEQSQVEWTPQALRAHTRFRVSVMIGWLAAAVLAATLWAQLF